MPFLLALLPFLEIYAFIEIGGDIGVGWTMLEIVVSSMFGMWLLSGGGLASLMEARRAVGARENPLADAFDAICLAMAGLLLLLPGFITDAIGLLLWFPLTRAALGLFLWARFSRRADVHVVRPGEAAPRGPTVIEGEFERLDE